MLLVSVAFLANAPEMQAAGSGERERRFAEVSQKVVSEQEYEFGTRVELTLEKGEAVRLVPERNKHIKEIILHHDSGFLGRSVLMTYVQRSSGSTMMRGPMRRATRTLVREPWIGEIVEWRREDGRIHVVYLTETDRKVWQAKRDEIAKEMSKQLTEQILNDAEQVRWDYDAPVCPFELWMDDPDDPELVELRETYRLTDVVPSSQDGLARLKLLTGWVHSRWEHSGSNTPSQPKPTTILKEASDGKRFRCVEYSIVTAACAQALGMPARVLGLRRQDVESARTSAGHVVAEVWLDLYDKWVMVDAQWNMIPLRNGVPLSAVELQRCLAERALGELSFASGDEISPMDQNRYVIWIAPYLYYFSLHREQRFGMPDRRQIPDDGPEVMVLVPVGAKKPKVFQGRPITKRQSYTPNPKTIYGK